MKTCGALCTNGHLLISLDTSHLYGNEMCRSLAFAALLFCLFVGCVQQAYWKENKNFLCARNFHGGSSWDPCLLAEEGRRRVDERDDQCHRQSKFLFCQIEHVLKLWLYYLCQWVHCVSTAGRNEAFDNPSVVLSGFWFHSGVFPSIFGTQQPYFLWSTTGYI